MTDADEFAQRTEPFRRELLAHCYRMLGAVDEAEDLVQETYLRAWRSYASFEGRSSLRVWLYRIATNVCLTALDQNSRRAIPSGLDGSASLGVTWLQPIPTDPATIVAERDSLRIALIAGLQHLHPRQRAVLILREVLAFPAAEVATMLDTTVAAVKSTLQRARARLDAGSPDLCEPASPEARALLDQYMAGFERADIAALERALRTDAAIELVGTSTWFSGRATCLTFLASVIGAPGDWQMIPTTANHQPAAAAYQRAPDGVLRAYGLGVLTATPTGVARIHVFPGGPDLLAHFNLPATIPTPTTVAMCGDDPRAPEIAGSLARDVGGVPAELGGLDRARQLEEVAGFVIALAFSGIDPQSAIPAVPSSGANDTTPRP